MWSRRTHRSGLLLKESALAGGAAARRCRSRPRRAIYGDIIDGLKLPRIARSLTTWPVGAAHAVEEAKVHRTVRNRTMRWPRLSEQLSASADQSSTTARYTKPCTIGM